MDVQKRLIDFIQYKSLSINEFERKCGISTGYVHKVKNVIGKRILWDIQNAFPDLNTNWLLTGEGEMLNPTGNTATANGTSSVAAINSHITMESNEVLKERVKHLEDILKEKERLIQVLMEGRK